MSQKDTRRLDHSNIAKSMFRDVNMEQIINDMIEEDTGAGFSEIIKSGVFTTDLITWTDSNKTLKRAHVIFNRTGPFVTSITKNIYDDDGITILASNTFNIARAGDNTVANLTSGVTRP